MMQILYGTRVVRQSWAVTIADEPPSFWDRLPEWANWAIGILRGLLWLTFFAALAALGLWLNPVAFISSAVMGLVIGIPMALLASRLS